MPSGKKIIHATLDPDHLGKDIPIDIGLIGDAGLTMDGLIADLATRIKKQRSRTAVAKEIAALDKEWLAAWAHKTDSDVSPLNPYRVLRDLWRTVDVDNTIITHDAGSPRDQLSPFWVSRKPLTYLGWGKTTQLGYGLGLAMGAKLAAPDKLCINVWGDAAIGFTGMDFETAVRERIPILSILLNNFSMAIELKVMPISTKKYRSTDISGDYAAMARASSPTPRAPWSCDASKPSRTSRTSAPTRSSSTWPSPTATCTSPRPCRPPWPTTSARGCASTTPPSRGRWCSRPRSR
jgi:acetolactate synthase-1/2/3 large subunit